MHIYRWILTALAGSALALAPAAAHGQGFLGKSAAEWQQALKDGKDARTRRNAAFALGKLGSRGASAAGTLKKSLDDGDATVREAAAFALGEIGRESIEVSGDSKVIDLLAKCLKDDNELVRRSAACALGNFGTQAKSALKQLEDALDDGSPLVQQNVAWALGRLGPETVPALRKALQKNDVVVRRDAAGSLGQLDPKAAKAALPELLACCQEPTNSGLRLAALTVLVKLVEPEDKKAAAAILPALKDADLEVRQSAAMCLGNIGGPESAPAVPILVDALTNGDADVKKLAAAAITNIGPDAESVVPTLIKALDSPDPDLRRNIVLALGGIGPKAEAAIPAVMKLLTDRREPKEARMEAAVSMNHFGPSDTARRALPDLLTVLQNPNDDADVRWRITWALQVYREKLADMPAVIRALTTVVKEPPARESKMLRYHCAYLLGMLKAADTPEPALDVLAAFLKDPDVVIYEKTQVRTGTAGQETRPGKTAVNEEGKDDGRIMAIQALNEIGPERLKKRPEIIRQLRAIAADRATLERLRKKAKELLDDLK